MGRVPFYQSQWSLIQNRMEQQCCGGSLGAHGGEIALVCLLVLIEIWSFEVRSIVLLLEFEVLKLDQLFFSANQFWN